MNRFKTLLALIFIAIGGSLSAQIVNSNGVIAVTIHHETTRLGLSELRTQLLAEGIDFRYIPKFDNNLQLTDIEFTISANNGQLTGSGAHHMMINTSAALIFHVNKTAGTFTVESHGDRQKQ